MGCATEEAIDVPLEEPWLAFLEAAVPCSWLHSPSCLRGSVGLNYSRAKGGKNHPQNGKTAAVGPFAKHSCLRLWKFTSKRLTFRMRKPQFHSLNPNHIQLPSVPTPDSTFIAGQTERAGPCLLCPGLS